MEHQNIQRFEVSTLLDGGVEDAWRFHANPANVEQVLPPGQSVKNIIGGSEASQGARFELEVSLFGWPVHWIGEWERVEFPNLLVDVGVKTPFEFWRHTHRFEAEGEQTRLTDIVEYRGGKGLLHTPGSDWFLQKQFRMLFAWRHWRTARIFRSTKAA